VKNGSRTVAVDEAFIRHVLHSREHERRRTMCRFVHGRRTVYSIEGAAATGRRVGEARTGTERRLDPAANGDKYYANPRDRPLAVYGPATAPAPPPAVSPAVRPSAIRHLLHLVNSYNTPRRRPVVCWRSSAVRLSSHGRDASQIFAAVFPTSRGRLSGAD